MTDLEDVPERRAEDQDGAIEVAFVDGTLPEEEPIEAPPFVTIECPDCATLNNSGVGTRLEKQAHGWKLSLVDGGTIVLSEGATITLALHRS
jgi:hypothetical protein